MLFAPKEPRSRSSHPHPMTVGTATVLQCAFNGKPITEMVPDLMEAIGATMRG